MFFLIFFEFNFLNFQNFSFVWIWIFKFAFLKIYFFICLFLNLLFNPVLSYWGFRKESEVSILPFYTDFICCHTERSEVSTNLKCKITPLRRGFFARFTHSKWQILYHTGLLYCRTERSEVSIQKNQIKKSFGLWIWGSFHLPDEFIEVK